ncbi:MAG: hypothetical protein NTU44_05830 [Bacteroidetes bacterium]|nr:hypothetical protein [Bacteroidota bacterium]
MDDFIAPVNPFPGIRSYEPHEDYLFFGREQQIKELIDRLSMTRFIAIIGSSGCGKSSLIKAGLIPSLIKGKHTTFEGEWDLFLCRPGDDPIGNLSLSLVETLSGNPTFNLTTDEAAQTLKKDINGLTGILKASAGGTKRNRLIYIDQFEELFRFKRSKADTHAASESARFVDLLLSTLRDEEATVFVVLSMRSDFLDECTEYRELTEAINQGHYLVPRMVREEIRKVITGPIAVFHGNIDETLIQRLLDEVGTNPDQLPILQHALMRTWDYWKIRRVGEEPINQRHYDAIGTMKEALSIHAEEIYGELPSPRAKQLSEKLFKSLIDFGEENKGTRHPTSLGEICSQAEARPEEMMTVIDRFREPGRAFLMPPYHVNLREDSIIDISHESIMRVWTRLKQWSEDELQSAQLYLNLARSARLYQEGKTGLWVNPELQLALRWYDQNRPNPAWAVRYEPSFERAIEYLMYSKKVYEQEIAKKENLQKRNLQRTRRFSVILGTASVISVLFLILALNMMFKSEANEKKALEKEKIATVESKAAAEQSEQAIIQKKISEQQQQIAEQQKIITEEQKDYAIKQQLIAEQQKKEAVFQRLVADQSKVAAEKARDDAESQRKEAVNQTTIADQERNKAAVSEQHALRLRMIAIGKSIAIQSEKMQTGVEGDLPALLAFQAYQFISENKGNLQDPDLYHALAAVSDDKLVLRGHNDEVRSIALSHSGNQLVSCSSDGSVRLWQINLPGAFQPFNTLKKGKNGFRSVAMSPDEKWVASGNTDGEILVWQTTHPEGVPQILRLNTFPVNTLRFLPSQVLVAGSSDGLIRVWDVRDKTPVLLNSISTGMKISQMDFQTDKNLLFISTLDGQVMRVKLQGQNPVPEVLLKSPKPIQTLCLTKDGEYLALGFSSGLIRIVKVAHPNDNPVDLIGHTSSINSLVFSPDGTILASCSYDRTIRLWKYLEPGIPPVVIDDNDKWVYGLSFGPDSQKIFSCGADKSIRQFIIDPAFLSGRVCTRVKRNLDQDEWNKYIGSDIPYQKTCTGIH